MSIKEQLMKDLQNAMRSGDDLRKSTLRMLRAAIQSAEMARSSAVLDALNTGGKAAEGPLFDEIRRHRKQAEQHEQAGDPEAAAKERDAVGALLARTSELDDNGVQDVLRKEIKQRRESVEAYERANRQELAKKELDEIGVIEPYLPSQMDEAAIEAEVRAIIAEVGAREMNKIMPVAMSRLKGRAEGRTVNRVVTRLLTEA